MKVFDSKAEARAVRQAIDAVLAIAQADEPRVLVQSSEGRICAPPDSAARPGNLASRGTDELGPKLMGCRSMLAEGLVFA